ncbi:MAG: C69 family dipeptidase [Bacteroidales bacterium]|nr:C69 family dipeptidase [Bacteroidales bacterium]
MKRLYSVSVFLLFTYILSAQSLPEGFNCSTIIVGKKASATGSVLIGHNEDDGGKQVVNLYKIYEDAPKSDKMVLKNGAVIDQTQKTYGYLWLEMPDQDFADSFLNENGVLVTSNSCPSRERYGEITDGGIGYNLRKLIAERAESARHGVELAGRLISELGYNASGRTYTIADTEEAWMLSVVRGKHWLAMRIPDNHVVYLPNFYIIEEIDFDDSDNYLYSDGLKEYAVTRNWHKEENGEFNFREAYGNERSAESISNIGRMWIGVNKMSPTEYDIEDRFPDSFVPDKPVAIDDIMNILQNHYEGTHLDDSEKYTQHNPHENKTMNICAGHQQMSFVAELRDDMPVEIGCRMWIAPRRGCVHAYMPVYYGISDFPSDYKYYDDNEKVYKNHFMVPDDMYNENNGKAWWSFISVTSFVDDDYGLRIDRRKEFKNKLQQEYFEETEKFDKGLMKLWNRNRDEALKAVTDFNNMIFDRALRSNAEYMQGNK